MATVDHRSLKSAELRRKVPPMVLMMADQRTSPSRRFLE